MQKEIFDQQDGNGIIADVMLPCEAFDFEVKGAAVYALIGCEESQVITIELRKLGIKAFSCDLKECSGGHPEWHLQCDIMTAIYAQGKEGTLWTQDLKPLLIDKWDIMIAHPPCTFLSHAGARWLYPKGILNEARHKQGMEAKEFFMKLLNAPIKKIAIENPVPSKIYGLPEHSQVIQPYQFGDEAQKKTLLWLKGLPKLQPTKIVGKGEMVIEYDTETKNLILK